jgi:hypothetical protein
MVAIFDFLRKESTHLLSDTVKAQEWRGWLELPVHVWHFITRISSLATWMLILSCKSDVDIFLVFTKTSNDDREEASRLSNTLLLVQLRHLTGKKMCVLVWSGKALVFFLLPSPVLRCSLHTSFSTSFIYFFLFIFAPKI